MVNYEGQSASTLSQAAALKLLHRKATSAQLRPRSFIIVAAFNAVALTPRRRRSCLDAALFMQLRLGSCAKQSVHPLSIGNQLLKGSTPMDQQVHWCALAWWCCLYSHIAAAPQCHSATTQQQREERLRRCRSSKERSGCIYLLAFIWLGWFDCKSPASTNAEQWCQIEKTTNVRQQAAVANNEQVSTTLCSGDTDKYCQNTKENQRNSALPLVLFLEHKGEKTTKRTSQYNLNTM